MMSDDPAIGFAEKFHAGDYAACAAHLSRLSSEGPESESVASLLSQALPALRPAMRSRLRDAGDGSEIGMKYLSLCGDAGVEFLLDWLAEEDEKRVRSRILSLVQTTDRSRLLKGMEKRLEDQRWFVVRNMVTIAGRLDLPDSVPFMEKALKSGDARVAREVVKVLFNSVSEKNAPLVLALLQHQDKGIRLQALRLVMMFGLERREASSALNKMASSDPVPEVRTLASSILA